jgi:hypothetical protein
MPFERRSRDTFTLPVKAVGNYRQAQPHAPAPTTTTERRLAQVAVFHGPRASIRFHDGATYSMPAEPLRKLGLVEGALFVMITEYRGKNVVSARVERHAEARGAAPERAQPKVMVRDGLKVTTRR